MSNDFEENVLSALNRVFKALDKIILALVTLGILFVAFYLMWDVVIDFAEEEEHSFAHIISELMFVLIVMELFRQVLRQLNQEAFSLNPFLFIGVIASVRGILITQMRLATDNIDFIAGVAILIVYAVIVLILVVCYYINSRIPFEEVLFKKKKKSES